MGKSISSGNLIGKIFKSNDYGDFKILSEIRIKGNRTKLEVEFLETGAVDCFDRNKTLAGNIRDRYKRIVYDVACIGKASKKGNEKEYSLWHSMIRRCYAKNDNSYCDYGAKGVTVCDRWLCFEYFLEDITKINGYDRELLYSKKLNLDKDKTQQHLPLNERIYSLETCNFITPSENVKLASQPRSKEFIAISPNGNIIKAKNMSDFAKQNNLSYSGIANCILGILKQHKGWKFYSIENYEKFKRGNLNEGLFS